MPGVAIGASVLITLIHLLTFAFGDGLPVIVAEAFFLLASLAATLASLYASSQLGAAGRQWRFFGFGCLSWFAGQSIWDAWIITTGNPPSFPSIADLGFLGLYPFFFIGLLLTIRSTIDELPARELVVDALIVIVVSGTLLFSLVLEPILENESVGVSGLVTSMLWLAGTFALVFLTLIALFWGSISQRRSLSALLVGLLAFAGSNVIYARLAVEDGYETGQIVDLGWHVGFLLIAAAGCMASHGERERTRFHSTRQLRYLSLSRSGILVLSILSFVGLTSWGTFTNEPHPAVAVGAVAVGLLLAYRLSYAAIQSDRLDQRTTEMDRLQGVLNASSTIAGTLDLASLLPQFARTAAESVGCTRGEVYLWTEDGTEIEACAYHGFTPDELNILGGIGDVPLGAFEAEREIMQHPAPRIQRVDEDDLPDAFRSTFRSIGKLQTIVGPLVAHGKVIGTFDLWTPHDMRPFQEADLGAVRAIGQQAGLAVHNARLLTASRRHAAEQEALLRVSQAAISQLDLRSVLSEIAQASLGIASAEACAIELWHPDANVTEMLAHTYAPDWSGPISIGNRYALDTWRTSRRVLREQIPLNLTVDDPSLTDHERTTFRNAGTKVFVVVPLVLRGESLGILTLFSRKSRVFTEAEVRLAQELAAQVALAIERARLYEALQERADTDGLTGLLNHRAVLERLDHEIARARRTAGTVGVMMIDLDGFKRINDTRGHQVGDQVLREVADVLRGTFREVDRLGRYGGDEFLVVLPQVSEADITLITSRLEGRMATTLNRELVDHPLHLSVGAAIYPADSLARDDLIVAADTRMYDAKGIYKSTRITTKPEPDAVTPAV